MLSFTVAKDLRKRNKKITKYKMHHILYYHQLSKAKSVTSKVIFDYVKLKVLEDRKDYKRLANNNNWYAAVRVAKLL